MADPMVPPPPEGVTIDTPVAPASVAPIIGRTPAPQTPAQASKDTSEAATAAEVARQNEYKVTQEGIATEKQQGQQGMSAEGLNELIASVEKAKGLVNDWSTGATGWALKGLPTHTDAGALDSTINQEIRGNIFLNRINQMKEENPSPTGGTGIGRIMQAEIPMITGAMGTLDPVKLGTKGTTDNLNQIEYRALRSKAILDGKDPDDPAIQKQYGIDKIAALLPPVTPPGGGSDGGTSPPGLSNLSDDQQKAYNAFLAANPHPTGDQVGSFLSHLTGRTVINGEGIAKDIAQGRGASSTVEDKTEQQKVQQQIAGENKLGLNQDSPTSRLLIHGATLNLSDEASGVGQALANVVTSPFTGKFDPVGSYQVGRDVERQRIADAQQKLGYGAIPVEFAGGLLAGNPEAAASKVSDLASFVKQGAKSGGAYGAVAGYGQGEGTQQSVVGAGVGGLAGAATGAVGGRYLAGREPSVPPTGGGPAPGDIATALQTEGIPAARPIADPSVRAKMGYLETTPGGNNVVRDSLDQTRRGIADKVAAVAGDGTVQTPGAMGQTIQDAGTRTLQSSKEAAQGVYKQAETAAGSTPIQPINALSRLDSYIAKLSRNPKTNEGVISYLKDVRGDLTVPENKAIDTGIVDQNGNSIVRPGAPPEPKTLADLRDIVTGANDKIGFQNLQKTRAEGIMFDVGRALNKDITTGLQQANPQALSLYNKADGMWSDMSKLRQQVVQKVIGRADNPISGEQTLNNVTNMMNNKGDLGRFNRVTNMMTPEEKSDFAATLFNNIGQRSPEEPFSSAYFLSQTKNMQPEALQTVFGSDGSKSIQNLRVASQGFKDATAALNNSRSGQVANWKDRIGAIVNLKSTLGGTAGYAVGGVPGAVAGAVALPAAANAVEKTFTGLSAKALMNPDVSSWIRKVAVAKSVPEVSRLVGKLNGIAAANGPIQSELTGLRDAILKAANDNAGTTGAAAASPNSGPDQQQQTNGSPSPAVRQ